MKKIGVVVVPFIPSEFQMVFMVQTLLSLKDTKHSHKLDIISVVNGYSAPEDGMLWLKQNVDSLEFNDRNNLSRAWNRGVALAFARGADYALLINLDLKFHPQFIENLVSFAEANPEALIWSGTEWSDHVTLENASLEGEPQPDVHFACFMIDRRLFQEIGGFDEIFEPAYHEDSDMLYRIRLKGVKVLTCPAARFYHLDRVTVKGAMSKEDGVFLDTLRVFMDKSMDEYVKKWGGLPGNEVYKTPYDKKM